MNDRFARLFKQMRILKRIAFSVGILLLLLWLFKFTSSNLRIEGYSGLMLKMLSSDKQTKYGPNYSHEKFLKVKVGMTEKDVIEVLGEPLLRWKPAHSNYLGLQYSEPQSQSGDYSLRQVYLEEGKVKEVIGYFYVD